MVTLTGTFTRLDGTPASGTVRVTPSRSPIMDPDGKIVISGPQVFPLDKDGKLTVQIPASNDPDLGPAFTYAVDVNLAHASWKISKVWIPHGSTTVDLSEIGDYQPVPGVATRVVTIPANGEDGQVLVWDGAGFTWADVPEGPQGPPGEVTTEALTTALAGKVTGTGMTVRHDTSVGERVLLDHPGGTTMLMGDTGWRDITSLIATPSLTLSQPTVPPRMKRVGDRVTLAGSLKNEASAAFVDLLSFPTGFLPTMPYVTHGVGRCGTNPIFFNTTFSAWTLRMTGTIAANVAIEFEISWSTNQAWPTTLPGLPL